MKIIKSTATGIAVIVALLTSVLMLAFADEDEGAESVLHRAVAEFQNQSTESDWMDDIVAIDRVSHFVLGPHLNRISNTDRERFEQAYSAALKRMISRESGRLEVQAFEITATNSRSAKDKILTSRVVTAGGKPEIIRWRMHLTSNGWRIVDIEAFNVWLVVEQRAQIGSIIDQSRGDIDLVIHRVSQTFQ